MIRPPVQAVVVSDPIADYEVYGIVQLCVAVGVPVGYGHVNTGGGCTCTAITPELARRLDGVDGVGVVDADLIYHEQPLPTPLPGPLLVVDCRFREGYPLPADVHYIDRPAPWSGWRQSRIMQVCDALGIAIIDGAWHLGEFVAARRLTLRQARAIRARLDDLPMGGARRVITAALETPPYLAGWLRAWATTPMPAHLRDRGGVQSGALRRRMLKLELELRGPYADPLAAEQRVDRWLLAEALPIALDALDDDEDLARAALGSEPSEVLAGLAEELAASWHPLRPGPEPQGVPNFWGTVHWTEKENALRAALRIARIMEQGYLSRARPVGAVREALRAYAPPADDLAAPARAVGRFGVAWCGALDAYRWRADDYPVPDSPVVELLELALSAIAWRAIERTRARARRPRAHDDPHYVRVGVNAITWVCDRIAESAIRLARTMGGPP